jgi:hypothetical protein
MIDTNHVQKYCKDDISKIENYEKAMADTTQTWHLHHRLALTLDGEFAHTHEELKRMNMYYNRPYFELIFLTNSEHCTLHKKGKALSDETRKKMSASKKGNNNFYGKHHSDESKHKMSEAAKGKHHSVGTRKKMSASKKGKNNPLYGKHHSDETRKKMSEAAKKRWSQQR